MHSGNGLKGVCHLLLGYDDYKCICGEFFKGVPQCHRCWRQDGRRDFYTPSFILRCPICREPRNYGELICYDCQFRMVDDYSRKHGRNPADNLSSG